MKLIRYNRTNPLTFQSFDRLSSLRELLDSAFQLAAFPGERAAAEGFAPALDLREDKEKVVVELELAGMKKEDFEVSVEGDSLVISGERKSETEQGDGESFRRERLFGRFSRSVSLPTPVEVDQISAAYKDGVLTVTLPKADEAKPKKIEVQVR